MDIRRLEVFCKVVELKSFTLAAKAVLLSQPSVSEHVRSLEEMVGEKLLDRLGREVMPTGAGQILYQYAVRIIGMRDEALQAIDRFRGRVSGNLPLGASTIPGAFILPALIESFKTKHSSIRIMLKISGTSRIVEELLQGTLELGVVGARPKDARLASEEVFSDELLLTVYPGHPWASRESVALEELQGQPFIQREPESGTRAVMNQALQGHGLDPAGLDVVAEMGSSEAVRQGIKARLGISILSSLAVAEDLRPGSLVAVPIEGLCIRRSFYLVQRKNRQLTPLALTFLHHLKAHATG
jgi:DNA-binding transcriptional LysR family regulator